MTPSPTVPRSAQPPAAPVFALAAGAIADEARALHLVVPGFRSPPAHDGVLRSIRRHPSGAVTVAVAVRGRPAGAVLADMVEGLVQANRLAGPEADTIRQRVGARLRYLGLPAPEAEARVA